MNLPSDLKSYRAPRDLGQWAEDSLAFLGFVAVMLLWYVAW